MQSIKDMKFIGDNFYIPIKSNDYALFFELFQCKISMIDGLDVDRIRTFGMPSTGNRTCDIDMVNSMVLREMSITTMATHFAENHRILIPNHNDLVRMYEIIRTHLTSWTAMLRDMHLNSAPIDDLILLDRFAASIYPQAKPLFTQQHVDSIFLRKPSTLVGMLRKEQDESAKAVTIKKKVEQYPSLSKFFVERKT